MQMEPSDWPRGEGSGQAFSEDRKRGKEGKGGDAGCQGAAAASRHGRQVRQRSSHERSAVANRHMSIGRTRLTHLWDAGHSRGALGAHAGRRQNAAFTCLFSSHFFSLIETLLAARLLPTPLGLSAHRHTVLGLKNEVLEL